MNRSPYKCFLVLIFRNSCTSVFSRIEALMAEAVTKRPLELGKET